MAVDLDTRIDLYTRVAQETSAQVIKRYSTSFGLASRLLDKTSRVHIGNLYALVRLADEIVDGVAEEAGRKSRKSRRDAGRPGTRHRTGTRARIQH
jgi:15-cis-phytoene synthase